MILKVSEDHFKKLNVSSQQIPLSKEFNHTVSFYSQNSEFSSEMLKNILLNARSKLDQRILELLMI